MPLPLPVLSPLPPMPPMELPPPMPEAPASELTLPPKSAVPPPKPLLSCESLIGHFPFEGLGHIPRAAGHCWASARPWHDSCPPASDTRQHGRQGNVRGADDHRLDATAIGGTAWRPT